MRMFARVYYAVATTMLMAVACFPWLRPLSYRVLGLDPRLAHSGTYAAFQAKMATDSLIRTFLADVLVLALSLGALSIVALVLRARRWIAIPWPLLVLTTVGAADVFMIALTGLMMQGGGMCC